MGVDVALDQADLMAKLIAEEMSRGRRGLSYSSLITTSATALRVDVWPVATG